MKYYFKNEKNKTTHTKELKTSADARHWVINNLDLSLNWTYSEVIEANWDSVKKKMGFNEKDDKKD